MILDEAQNVKNAGTKQARAARTLPGGYRIALTGTPVENNVGDLWSLMEFLNPAFLGSESGFRKRFFVPIQVYADRGRVRPAASHHVAVHPAEAEDRQEHHRRPARQTGDEGLLQSHQRAGFALRSRGKGRAGGHRIGRRHRA